MSRHLFYLHREISARGSSTSSTDQQKYHNKWKATKFVPSKSNRIFRWCAHIDLKERKRKKDEYLLRALSFHCRINSTQTSWCNFMKHIFCAFYGIIHRNFCQSPQTKEMMSVTVKTMRCNKQITFLFILCAIDKWIVFWVEWSSSCHTALELFSSLLTRWRCNERVSKQASESEFTKWLLCFVEIPRKIPRLILFQWKSRFFRYTEKKKKS